MQKFNIKKNRDVLKFTLSKCKSEWTLVYSQSCTTITAIQLDTILTSPGRSLTPVSKLLPFALALFVAATSVLHLPVLGISRSVWGLGGLAFFTERNVFKVCLSWTMYQSFPLFSCPNDTLCITIHAFCLSTS